MSSANRNEESESIPEPKPEIGEVVEMWIEGHFDVRCDEHIDDESIEIEILPGQFRTAMRDGDSFRYIQD